MMMMIRDLLIEKNGYIDHCGSAAWLQLGAWRVCGTPEHSIKVHKDVVHKRGLPKAIIYTTD